MTRKDYIKFAAMLKDNRPELLILTADKVERQKSFAQHALWCHVVQSTADIFERDNERFDRDRFLQAAGLSAA